MESDALQEPSETGSWLRGWFKWIPTSMSLLRAAEKKILAYIKTPYRGSYLGIGHVVGEDDKVWTISLNEKSNRTPLVLVHGFGSGVALWCLNLDALAGSRPVHAFDLLGFGASSRPPFSSDALEAERQLVQTIEEWRREMKLERFVLLGHSMGGFLATSYAIRYPTRVAHLILADPWGFPERPLEPSQHFQVPMWVKAVAYVLRPFNPLSGVRAAGPFGPKLIEKVRPDLIRKFSALVDDEENSVSNYIFHCNAQKPTGEEAFRSMMSGFGFAKFPMLNRVDSLHKEVPMTMIYGSRSWVDHGPGGQIQQLRKGSYVDVQVINGAGHHVYADKCEQFNGIVLQACKVADRALANQDALGLGSLDKKELISEDSSDEKLPDESPPPTTDPVTGKTL